MTKCLECGAPTEVLRVIVEGTDTWREERCVGKEKHVRVTVQHLGDPKTYRRIRAKYWRDHQKKHDTGILQIGLAS